MLSLLPIIKNILFFGSVTRVGKVSSGAINPINLFIVIHHNFQQMSTLPAQKLTKIATKSTLQYNFFAQSLLFKRQLILHTSGDFRISTEALNATNYRCIKNSQTKIFKLLSEPVKHQRALLCRMEFCVFWLECFISLLSVWYDLL